MRAKAKPVRRAAFVAVIAGPALAACSYDTGTGALAIGPDTYTMSKRYAPVGGSAQAAGSEILANANQYCAQAGRQCAREQGSDERIRQSLRAALFHRDLQVRGAERSGRRALSTTTGPAARSVRMRIGRARVHNGAPRAPALVGAAHSLSKTAVNALIVAALQPFPARAHCGRPQGAPLRIGLESRQGVAKHRGGSRGSDPRLLGLTIGGHLEAHTGSDPVRSRIARIRGLGQPCGCAETIAHRETAIQPWQWSRQG